MPPNYDEIDPPPSYSTLFPGNKTIEQIPSSTNEQHRSETDTSSSSQTSPHTTVTQPNAITAVSVVTPSVFILPVNETITQTISNNMSTQPLDT